MERLQIDPLPMKHWLNDVDASLMRHSQELTLRHPPLTQSTGLAAGFAL
jgi:hypothetical protein